jgi:hypothetical protein
MDAPFDALGAWCDPLLPWRMQPLRVRRLRMSRHALRIHFDIRQVLNNAPAAPLAGVRRGIEPLRGNFVRIGRLYVSARGCVHSHVSDGGWNLRLGVGTPYFGFVLVHCAHIGAIVQTSDQ